MKRLLSLAAVIVTAVLLSTAAFAQLVSPIPQSGTAGFNTGNDRGPTVYQVNYFSNRNNSLSYDQFVRIVNTGATNSPLGDQEGYLCANLYVFDNTQEMLECCSCPMSANELLTLSLNGNLTANSLTGAAPNDGVVKLVSTTPVSYTAGSSDSNGTTTGPTVRCNAEQAYGLPILVGDGEEWTPTVGLPPNTLDGQLAAWATHVQIPVGTTTAPGVSATTEAAFTPAELSFTGWNGTVNGEAQFLPLSCSFVHFLGSGKGRCTCPVIGDQGGLNH